ncbi:hypothetical protein JOQ06_007443 [Pogonophryne albipinna]|uniref:C1q domain-containing protein n=1 Tax=Pogonophryne albipinna TaxID=1090488 RepID=A0AAD6FI80_9TELE|nr:hypothetical protein JOQ06_007443 [Pogonophryne albipinna]
MVVEQKVELRHLASRVTAAESLVDALEKENTAMEARMTAAESLAEELQMENDLKLQSLHLLSRSSAELEKQQEGQEMDIQELQNTNIGNHYKLDTGYFTAPARGVYYFRFTGHLAHSDISMIMKMFMNEDLIVTSGDHNYGSNYADASNGVVLQLEVGDVVSVQLRGKVWDDHYHRTTFSGFLLFPL